MRHAIDTVEPSKALVTGLLEALCRVPFFALLSDPQLMELARRGHTTSVAGGSAIFLEGEPADGLYVLLAGEARVIRNDAGGQAVELARLSQGDFFGELALLDGGVRSATVSAVSPCDLFMLRRQTFLELMLSTPEVLSQILSSLTSKVRATSERFFREELAARTLQMRMELDRHRSMAQMVAGVAHELNTPLGVVRTALGVIEDQLGSDTLAALADNPEGQEFVSMLTDAMALVRKNLVRANRLVQDFKKVSGLDAEEPHETLDLSECLTDAVELFGMACPNHGHSIDLRLIADASQRTWVGPGGSLSEVLVGLLANVANHAYAPGLHGTIAIELKPQVQGDRAGFHIQVVDRGNGMPTDILEHAFDPFVTTSRSRGSTGLGLAIVHNRVTSTLGGTISLESSPGEGTTVQMWIPAAVARASAQPLSF